MYVQIPSLGYRAQRNLKIRTASFQCHMFITVCTLLLSPTSGSGCNVIFKCKKRIFKRTQYIIFRSVGLQYRHSCKMYRTPIKEKSDNPADKYFKANAKDREVRAWHCTLLKKGELHKYKYNPVKISFAMQRKNCTQN